MGIYYYDKDSKKYIPMSGFSSSDSDRPKAIIPKTCSQCGAPININRHACEYCGVRY